MGTKDNAHGEGNYEATRQYNAATKRFVASGRVEQAARDAAPHSAREAREMKEAEKAALLRAKEPGGQHPVKEPRQAPAMEDPLPEDGPGADNAASRH